MRKTYKAISDVSFNIFMRGRNKRVSFHPITAGGSIYRTSDPEEMKAIEAKDSFNTLFECIEIEGDAENEESSEGEGKVTLPQGDEVSEGGKEKVVLPEDNEGFEGDDGPDGNEDLKKIEEIDNLADARNYLKENGAGGNDLRSKIAIVEVARSLGIVFPNLK